ncbi:DNA-binding transcriptional regulator, LysR family [Lentibacillus halodurans]|uniref:DNA-binding transcriptional regulator, LysR family n=1 Tax=Lentibacillus halodurans TaxID=237679 RepID=A0A1I1AIC2_9BACI|nr:LysR family transcriptional regulator [Lentibacillus halodurans]SFB37781.1 DNA-binding transcriptional regulator, LysR family [Lentibacillus halodurans]
MIDKMKTFLEVACERNITKAAENLYSSQSTISMKIKSLEDHLGTKLFDRTKKTMGLTKEGKIFYDYASEICSKYDEVSTIIQQFKQLNMGTLSVAAGSYFGSYVLPELLGAYKEKYPTLDVQVTVAFSHIIMKEVILNNHELGIIGELEEALSYSQLVCKPFFEDELMVICSPTHPSAEQEFFTIDDLKRNTFIKSDKSSALRTIIEKRLGEAGIKTAGTMILNNIETIKRTVEQNLGISILPRLSVIREFKTEKLAMKPIENLKLTRNLYYIHRNDKVLSRPAEKFLELTLDYFQKKSD